MQIKQHRSYTANARPAAPYDGQLYINIADMQVGLVDQTNTPIDLLPLRFHSPVTAYKAGDLVVQGHKFWRALTDLNPKIFDPADWEEAGGTGGNVLIRQTQLFDNIVVGTTDFAWPHDPVQIEAFLNGSRLVLGNDFTADGTTVTLTQQIQSTQDILVLITTKTIPIANAIDQAFADNRYLLQSERPLLAFSAAKAYNQDDLVWVNGAIWVAKAAITPGPFDSTRWLRISGARTQQRWVAVAGQTAFAWAHNAADLNVLINGVALDAATDYTATGSVITLTAGANAGDIVEAITRS